MRTYLLLRLLFLCFCSFTYISSSPYIYWHTQPVLPGSTLLLYGAGFNDSTTSICISNTSTCLKSVEPVQQWEVSSKVVIEETWSLAVYRVAVCSDSDERGVTCSTAWVNMAEITWMQGYAINTAAQGSMLYIFGRALGFESNQCISTAKPSATSGSSVVLVSSSNQRYEMSGVMATCYDLQVPIPATLPTGTYKVEVSNALQQTPTTVNRTNDPLVLTVISPPTWPTKVFDVRKSFGGNITSAVEAAQEVGGIVYVSSGPCIQMENGKQINFGNGKITLQGDTSRTSCVEWSANSVPPSAPLVIGASYRLLNISLVVTSLMKGAFISAVANSSNIIIDNVNITINTGLDNLVGNSIQFHNVSQVEITNSFVSHVGNCTADWPYYLSIFLNGGQDYKIMNNVLESSCSDYAVYSVDNTIFAHNTLLSIGSLIAEGNGFNTLGITRSLSHVAFIRNCQTGSSTSAGENEAWTEDGPGGAYVGLAKSSAGSTSVLLASPASSSNWAGGVVFVLGGTGAGQFARIVDMNTTVVTIYQPFPIPIDDSSIISVTAYHGDVIVAGNSFSNGTTIQTYGSATNQIFADNTIAYMKNRPNNRYNVLWSGLNLIGKEYGGGQQPNYFVEVYNNFLVNSEYLRAWAIMGGPFGGPWIRGVAMRGNQLVNTSLVLQNYVSDIVVESNSFSQSDPTIAVIGNQTESILFRLNFNSSSTPVYHLVVCPDWRNSLSSASVRFN